MAVGSASSPVAPAHDPGGRSRDGFLISLTFAAGVVDAVSFLGLGGIFTANMTGNVIFLALAVGKANLLTALHSVDALLGFSLGAILAGRLLGPRTVTEIWPARVTWVLAGELACLTAFAGGWAYAVELSGGPVGSPIYVLIAFSAIGMGMQNAVARHLDVPGLTTTVLTRSLTGFMVDLPALGVSGPFQRRALLTVLALFAGAAIGAVCFWTVRVLPPFVTVATVFAVVFAARARFRPRRSAPPCSPDRSGIGPVSGAAD